MNNLPRALLRLGEVLIERRNILHWTSTSSMRDTGTTGVGHPPRRCTLRTALAHQRVYLRVCSQQLSHHVVSSTALCKMHASLCQYSQSKRRPTQRDRHRIDRPEIFVVDRVLHHFSAVSLLRILRSTRVSIAVLPSSVANLHAWTLAAFTK